MSAYVSVTCPVEPTESTSLMDDYVWFTDNESEAGDGTEDAPTKEPLPTTTSDAPVDAPNAPTTTVETPSVEPQPEEKPEDAETVTATASTIRIEVVDGVCRIVSSSSSQTGASLDVPEALSVILAQALAATEATTKDAVPRAPSPLSDETVRAIKAAKSAEIKAANAKYAKIECDLDEASSAFSTAKATLNDLVNNQNAIDQSFTDLTHTLADLCTKRTERRVALNEFYKTVCCKGDLTVAEKKEFNSQYAEHQARIKSFDALIEKSQEAAFLVRGDITIKHLSLQIEEQAKVLDLARRKRDGLKKERQDQEAIVANLERELSLL